MRADALSDYPVKAAGAKVQGTVSLIAMLDSCCTMYIMIIYCLHGSKEIAGCDRVSMGPREPGEELA
jgi:hypothetical protein